MQTLAAERLLHRQRQQARPTDAAQHSRHSRRSKPAHQAWNCWLMQQRKRKEDDHTSHQTGAPSAAVPSRPAAKTLAGRKSCRQGSGVPSNREGLQACCATMLHKSGSNAHPAPCNSLAHASASTTQCTLAVLTGNRLLQTSRSVMVHGLHVITTGTIIWFMSSAMSSSTAHAEACAAASHTLRSCNLCSHARPVAPHAAHRWW